MKSHTYVLILQKSRRFFFHLNYFVQVENMGIVYARETEMRKYRSRHIQTLRDELPFLVRWATFNNKVEGTYNFTREAKKRTHTLLNQK